MKFLFVFFLAFLNIVGANQLMPEQYLKDRIPVQNRRYSTLLTVLKLMKERNVRTLVETGTSRDGLSNFEGDGGSTIIFSQYANENNVQFYSVDIDQKALTNAQNAVNASVGKIGSNIQFVRQDSIAFLKNFQKEIDFLYLDSYDFDFNDPLPSQNHHLNEIKAAYSHLTPNTIIMIDDCDLPHGGKGRLVIDFLLEKGWTVLEKKYQVILVRS